MTGFYETQVRRAMMTVGDADVLNEMATGWRASIRDLNTVDDRLASGIRGLRDHDQLGDQTRDAAIGAFRDMRDYVAEQRLMLGRTAQALDAAGGALTQVKSLIRSWDRAGVPVAPGPAPVPDPAATDQTAYWDAANAHQRATAGYAQQVQQREDEARAAWDSLNRVFTIAEDKIRSAHGIPREERPTTETQPEYPPVCWPGPPPEQPPPPGWPPLPPWPPVREKPGPERGPATGLPPGPGAGPGLPPGPHPGPGPGMSSTHPDGTAHPVHDLHAPTTTVSGSSQSGVAYAPGSPGAISAGPVASPGSGVTAPMGLTGMAGAAGAAGASAGMAMRGGAGSAGAGAAGAATRAGAAGRSAGGGASARSGQTGQTGQSGRSSRGGRNVAGGKGSQQASGQSKSGRGSAGAAGSRGGRRKDKAAPARDDLLATDDRWLDGEGTAPDVLR
ncbi:hypothetical protein [Nocardioides astragali]|uniref:PPE domain-containing protein n=1 Tax=Nocardioides astragali TaxID=1776736 RepID=A0ABW2N396_9ACTN|nr:hypothetical protein [Nocardioides astragali]